MAFLDLLNLPALLATGEQRAFTRPNIYDKGAEICNFSRLLYCRSHFLFCWKILMLRPALQLDLGLTGLVTLLAGLLLLATGFSTPLTCVPTTCTTSPAHVSPTTKSNFTKKNLLQASCALDWSYQSGICKAEAASLGDSTLHLLLAGVSVLLLSLLSIPLYWGSTATKELYDNFYYIWAKLRNGDEETKDAEWKRRWQITALYLHLD